MTQLTILRIDARRTGAAQELARLRERLSPHGDVVSGATKARTVEVFGEPLSPMQIVERICADVQRDGLDAVLDYSARIDKAALTPETLRVAPDELAAAHAAASSELLEAVRRIRQNILRFQTAVLPRDVRIELPGGGYLAQRYLPLRRVGVCVPGGAAAYPSTVLMTVVPAQAAGVEQLAIVAPPTRYGAYNMDLLATCHELGITEVYRVGGAQAVAALAFGVSGIEPVDKIVGPGNLFVALAKKHVFGQVDIDAIAGPSEVVVLADDSADPAFVAADLIAQAEHAPGASILIACRMSVLDDVSKAIQSQLATLDRSGVARESLESFGAMILCADVDAAARIADEIAPEHLHLALRDAEAVARRIRNAGAVFLGQYSPVALGDYAAGPSHVLPTGGTARFASGLSAGDFLRSHSLLAGTKADLAQMAEDVRILATCEGLTAHRRSVEIRLNS